MKSISHWIAAAALMLSGTAAHAEPVTLDIWTIDRPDQYIYLLKDEFEQAHPDIKLNVKTVQFRDMVNDLARATVNRPMSPISTIPKWRSSPRADCFLISRRCWRNRR
jgi:ABC-type glycerol-3-phosphate transport system substrate-binding protein